MEQEIVEITERVVSEIVDDPDVLLIAGGTGSGKSTIARAIQSRTHGLIMSLDDYFLDEKDLEMAIPEYNIRQWDTPDCYDWSLLKENLNRLLLGNLIKIPIRSRFLHKRVGWHRNVVRQTGQLIIVDGLYALDDRILSTIEASRANFFGVFLDVDPEIRWDRTHERDVSERHENPVTLRSRFDEVIRPAEVNYLDKQRGKSHMTIVG